MYWDSPNNNKAQSTYQMCHLIKISNVEELNKTSLFNGSIIKTCVGKKKACSYGSNYKAKVRITRDDFIYTPMPQAPRTRPRFDHSEVGLLDTCLI